MGLVYPHSVFPTDCEFTLPAHAEGAGKMRRPAQEERSFMPYSDFSMHKHVPAVGCIVLSVFMVWHMQFCILVFVLIAP